MINLRQAKLNDVKFVLSLRNEKTTRRAWIKDQSIIPLKNHLKWFPNHLHEYKIIIYNNKCIGYLRLDKSNGISICLLPEYRNKGIGSKILKEIKGNALIKIENKSSLYMFTNAGFKLIGFYLEKR